MKEYKSIDDAQAALKKYQEQFTEYGGVIPPNTPEFLDPFTYLLRHVDINNDGEFEFDGEGSYYGKQITIYFEYGNHNHHSKRIEIAYDQDHCTIYTGNNEGFWSPPYAELSGTKYADIRNLLFTQIRKCVGI